MDIRVIERSMAPEFNDTKPIFGTDAVQVWAIAAVPSSPTDAASPAPELEAAPLTPAQDAPAAVAAVEAADQPPADDADADAGSATSSEKKRKRSPSPPRTLAPTEFAPVEPTPTAATHPYRRRSATHSANVTRLLLNGMFKSVELAAIRPAHLPLIGAGPRPTHSPYDVMPALARPANDVFLSYVLVGPEKRGKVDTDKSDALGVPRGRLGMLTAGQNVLVTDPQTGAEVTITPDQIMGPSTKPTATVVVHCPTADYIDSLVQAPLWERLFGSDGDAVRPVHVMWHKAGVWEDERYRSWMAKFGPDVVVRSLPRPPLIPSWRSSDPFFSFRPAPGSISLATLPWPTTTSTCCRPPSRRRRSRSSTRPSTSASTAGARRPTRRRRATSTRSCRSRRSASCPCPAASRGSSPCTFRAASRTRSTRASSKLRSSATRSSGGASTRRCRRTRPRCARPTRPSARLGSSGETSRRPATTSS